MIRFFNRWRARVRRDSIAFSVYNNSAAISLTDSPSEYFRRSSPVFQLQLRQAGLQHFLHPRSQRVFVRYGICGLFLEKTGQEGKVTARFAAFIDYRAASGPSEPTPEDLFTFKSFGMFRHSQQCQLQRLPRRLFISGQDKQIPQQTAKVEVKELSVSLLISFGHLRAHGRNIQVGFGFRACDGSFESQNKFASTCRKAGQVEAANGPFTSQLRALCCR